MHSFVARERCFCGYVKNPSLNVDFPPRFLAENNLPDLYKRTLLSSGMSGKKSITSFTCFSCLFGSRLRKAAEPCPGLMTCYDIWLQLLWYYIVKRFCSCNQAKIFPPQTFFCKLKPVGLPIFFTSQRLPVPKRKKKKPATNNDLIYTGTCNNLTHIRLIWKWLMAAFMGLEIFNNALLVNLWHWCSRPGAASIVVLIVYLSHPHTWCSSALF